METLKQPTFKTCQHAVLAMIVSETVEYVIDWFGSDAPLCAEDANIFLVHHGVYPSIFAGYVDAKKGDFYKFGMEDTIDFSVPLKNRPAILIVWSERFKDKHHAVFWDGNRVHDPNPNVLKPRSISTYKIIEYWPLLLTAQQHDRICNI